MMERTRTTTIIVILLGGLIECESRVVKARFQTDGMAPTIKRGESILVDTSAYAGPKDIRRWDVVVLRDPDDGSRRTIKRVLGLPGETIRVIDERMRVNNRVVPIPEAIPLREDEWSALGTMVTPGGGNSAVVHGTPPYPVHLNKIFVPEEHVFVVGDNIARSRDSLEFGPVAASEVVGRVLLE